MSSKLLRAPVKLALVQLATGADKTANLARARSQVLQAAQDGARIVVLPECFNSPYGTQYFAKYAEQLLPSPPTEAQSPTFHALAALARESGAYLVGGSIPERVPAATAANWLSNDATPGTTGGGGGDDDSTERLYNTSLTFGPDGALLATHRKVHLFDIDIPGGITFRESDVLSPGQKLTLVDLPAFGRIAVAICYDIRFPELAMIAARRGAFALVYPGAFNLTTGPRHWELLARARAVDNQAYVALCSPARDMDASYHAWGHSLVVDPNGEVVAEADEKPGIVTVELTNERLEEVRKGIPVYTQRRFDVYPDVAAGKVRTEE